jgi:hypothetical protein
LNEDFARNLIEHPGESVTQELFAGGIPGVFWVDWREADTDIVKMAAEAIGTDDLKVDTTKGKFVIVHRKKRTVVPLTGKPGEQGIVLASLNKALAPHIEIRLVRASDGGDTLAYMPLRKRDWTAYQAIYGPKLHAAFAPIDLESQVAEAAEIDPVAMKQMLRQTRALKFGRARFRVHTTRYMEEARANPALAGPAMPVFEPVVGDLVLSYFHELRPTYPPVTVGELERYDMPLSELHEQAYQNEVAGWKTIKTLDCQSYFTMSTENGTAASLVIRGNIWEEMEKIVGVTTAAFPHRDLVMFASTSKPEGIAAMRDAIAKMDFNRPDALSRDLFDRQGKRWLLRPSS